MDRPGQKLGGYFSECEPARDVRDVRGEGARVGDTGHPDALSTPGAHVAAVGVLVSAVPLGR